MTTKGLRHLRLADTGKSYSYTAYGGGGGEYQRPPRDRVRHAQKLRGDLAAAEREARERGFGADDALIITYELQPHAIEVVDSLERQRSGIQLLSVSTNSVEIRATVRVPASKVDLLRNILNRYESEIDKRSGRPKEQVLVENVNAIRLATERDLWTDNVPFPEPSQPVWWELWLCHDRGSTPESTFKEFQLLATAAGLKLRERFIVFPDRLVTVGFGRFEDWSRKPLLLLHLAELRQAKELASEYLRIPRTFQGEIVRDLAARITHPSPDAPAVCLLDTGVDHAHPLLRPALAPSDVLAVESGWGGHDHSDCHHGTTMAGIALFDSLADALKSTAPVDINHRLESVKILPPTGENAPDSYGSITQFAVGLAETVAPNRRRVACLAVTADCRDGGVPSSWSAAVDELAAGGEVFNNPQLVCISAGNLRKEIHSTDYDYPVLSGECAGIEDPAQAWNAVTVGAITHLAYFDDPSFRGYQPVAPSGDLSPTSRTSLAWPEEQRDGWAIKPDIVMEGGNWAADAAGTRDTPDALGILTTSVTRSGALLTTTRDTSPATAAAARLAAQIWSEYPELRPETIRGLIVHSARWTDAMQKRFPAKRKDDIQQRLRCYGYGVPDKARAIYSASNAVTLLVEDELQPYKKDGSECKTNEMRLHALPWPVEALQALGSVDVTMRVTLSYFIEPSPGRRGWTNRHCYASHGLRFELQRPLETTAALLERLSASALAAPCHPNEHSKDNREWVVGSQKRNQGSLHCDWWQGTAADLCSMQTPCRVPGDRLVETATASEAMGKQSPLQSHRKYRIAKRGARSL
ncbi:MAG: S8 family peptidase [Polyangiaceae bacterium]